MFVVILKKCQLIEIEHSSVPAKALPQRCCGISGAVKMLA
jgi:hypothetical protein